MTANDAEVLSAFFDGEAVEPAVLAACLQAPDAADLLLEFARLRRAVREDESRPTFEFSDGMFQWLAKGEKRRKSLRRAVQIGLAASLALAAALGGFGMRELVERRQPAADGHAPTRPASAASQEVAVPVVKTPSESGRAPSKRAVPSPTLRIRFAEWRDTVL